MKKIYVAVTGDLFHHGHISFFKKAKAFGNYLVVGVCSDEDVTLNGPILNLNERVAVIERCDLVNEVIPSAPPETTEKFIEDHQIDLVVATKSYSKEALNMFYKYPNQMGILKLFDYKDGISKSYIFERSDQLYEKRKGI